jgi:CHASE2 domain-containing sensor protein
VSSKFIQLNDRIITGVALAIIACLIAWSGALLRFDNFCYDIGSTFSFKPAPDNIVIVAIDVASLNSLGRWPWSRIVHAELVSRLSAAHPRVIGLDLDFSEPELNNPNVDNVFAGAIGQARNVVLPILAEQSYIGSGVKLKMPLPSFAYQAAMLGRVHFSLDSDGIARSFYLWEGLSADGLNATGLPHFSQSVSQVANSLPSGFDVNPPTIKVADPIAIEQGGFVSARLASSQSRKINFFGPLEHFQRISYTKVLAGDYSPDFFKDKIVLVGLTAHGLGDALPTPVSTISRPMPRVEFHANVIAAMQHDKLVVDTPLWLTILISILLAILPLLWLPKLTLVKSLLTVGCYFLLVIVLAVSLPHVLNVWVPPSGALVAILLAYPIWNWRKLDSAQGFLDIELQGLRDELASLGMEQEDTIIDLDEDPLQARLLKVKLTAKHLRELHRGRSDTLAFISHDIRAPLGSAMMLLDQFEVNKYSERMKRMLGRAYSMSESFLQASRAEMANVNKFHGMDMVGVVQQAVDDIYEMAVAKQLKLETYYPEESLWVRGDFGLLLRAVSNILLNAVNYSPIGAAITVLLERDHQFLTLKIKDQGPGIPASKVSKIFKRFSRADAEHQSREGSGLGLYFVNVTIKKHHGTVAVQSKLGHGAMFVVTLPLERRRGSSPVENDRRTEVKTLFNDTI